MQTLIKPKKTYTIRSPTLQTVLMVENFIEKNNGKFKKMELFDNLPKKVMWQTFQTIMRYLEDTYKIIFEKNGKISYIWNPELVKKFRNRPDLTWQK